jgi:hypothetical protein
MSFPFERTYRCPVQPVTTVGNTLRMPVFRAKEAETVTSVVYIPTSTQNGADTNSRTLNVYNRNATDGTGTTLIATLALVAGVNLVDNVAKTITLSGTAANLNLTAGQVVEWESLAVSTGIADPGGLVEIKTTRTTS